MIKLLIALLLLAFASALPLFIRKRDCFPLCAGINILAALLGIISTLRILFTGKSVSYFHSWSLPGDGIILSADPLSAFFLLALFIIAPLAAVYGHGYMSGTPARRNLHAGLFNLLTLSLALVFMCEDAISFLIAWELMTVSSFLLVMHHGQKPQVRQAGWLYFSAATLGTAFLMAGFALSWAETGSTALAAMKFAQSKNFLLVCALIGFGVKAGIMPFHIWLPKAHPAAPSHVSALMSGILIKTGIYGILRIILSTGSAPAWLGWTLLYIGLAAAVLAALMALAQQELKKLLAYSSIENIGIICCAAGLAMLGIALGNSMFAMLGFCAAFLHIFNHALFKSLLFMGAGSVLHATGTADMERLGGLAKKLPVTAFAFFIGCLCISALVPFSGFAGEFLLYLSALTGLLAKAKAVSSACLLLLTGLALAGTVAAAAYVKAYSAVFLGAPRAKIEVHGPESRAIKIPLFILAALCVISALSAPLVLTYIVWPAVSSFTSAFAVPFALGLAKAQVTLVFSTVIATMLLVTALWIYTIKQLKLSRAPRAETWGCGYTAATPRVQYTGLSFALPILNIFSGLTIKKHRKMPEDLFPKNASFSAENRDLPEQGAVMPFFAGAAKALEKLKIIQHGNLHLYVLYIIVALLTLLFWGLR